MSPGDYPDDHPGWDALMRGIVDVSDRHPPGHVCGRCEDTRTVHDVAVEIVETWERSRHPALQTIVRRLRQATRRHHEHRR